MEVYESSFVAVCAHGYGTFGSSHQMKIFVASVFHDRMTQYRDMMGMDVMTS
jgi:hypothetical protein